jgi:rare lipoprotein A
MAMRFLKGRGLQPKTIFYLIILLCCVGIHYQCFAPIKFSFPVRGYASWYSRNDPGIDHRTANNEVFNDQDMTCAMWGVPFGTMLRVTNRSNGKYVIVRVNDRGPHRRYVLKENRVVDLTKEAFAQINPTKKGLIPVKVEKL